MVPPVVAALQRKVSSLVNRGRINLVDDTGKGQRVQVGLLADETKDGVERVQPYGLTTHPLEGAEAVALFVGGGRDHGLVVNVDDRRHRPRELEPGDVQLYNDQAGTHVKLTREQTIVIACKTLRITCEVLELTATTSITVTSPSVDVNES